MFYKPAAASRRRSRRRTARPTCRPPPTGPFSRSDTANPGAYRHAYFRLHDALRRLRRVRGHLPLRHHAHRQDLSPRLQHRAQHVLGVLFLREDVPAARHRRPRATPTSRRSATASACAASPRRAPISWKIKFRDGREKDFVSPIRTTPWGSIEEPKDFPAPTEEEYTSQELWHEPAALKIDALPTLRAKRRPEDMGWFNTRETITVDADVLVIGGGFSGCGAAYEAGHWGRDMKVVVVEKANIERMRRGRPGPLRHQLLHGHALGREPARGSRPLRAQRPHGTGARRPRLRHRTARRRHRAQVRRVGPADDARPRDRPLPARRQVADHDPRRELQADHRRGRPEVGGRDLQPDHGDAPAYRQEELQPDRRAVGFSVRSGDFYVFRAKAVVITAGGASHIFRAARRR